MAAYYSVKKNRDGTVDIESNNPNAKLTIWSWAGGGLAHDPGAFELYGTDTGYGGPGDRKRWRWHLTSAGIASITRSLKIQLANPKEYDTTAAENAAARELLKKLGGASAGGGKKRKAGSVGPREAAAFVKGKAVGAQVRFQAEDGVPRLGTVKQVGDPGWFIIRSDKTGVYHSVHVSGILNIIKPAPRSGGKKRHAAPKRKPNIVAQVNALLRK